MSRTFQTYKSSDEPVPGYRLVRFLGKGNFGEVWMASAPGNKKVALKIIDRFSDGRNSYHVLEVDVHAAIDA